MKICRFYMKLNKGIYVKYMCSVSERSLKFSVAMIFFLYERTEITCYLAENITVD